MALKIAIDSAPLASNHKVRGIGMHTNELLEGLKRNSSKGIEIIPCDLSKEDISRFDVVHYTSFNPFFINIPFKKPKRIKIVLTIHDLIPLVFPNHYKPGLRGKIKYIVNKFLIWKNVDKIITISETSKKDICRFLGVDPNKVEVIYLAPRDVFHKISDRGKLNAVKKKYNLPDNFVLYVGDVNYNKNILTLIKACEISDRNLAIAGKQAKEVENLGIDIKSLKGPMDYIRYLFGKPHPELAHHREIAEEFERSKNIYRLGFVKDSDLGAIYNLASVYCQPSLYEGFSLPVLEALACGTPVVASKIQVHKEIAEGAVRLAEKDDPESFAAGFDSLIENPKLPREYSWEKTAKETIEVYKSLV